MDISVRIHTKLMLSIIVPLAVIYISVIGWMSFNNRNNDLEDAKVIADSFSSGYADKIKSQLDYEVGIIQGITNALNKFSEIPSAELESNVIRMMESTLLNREEFLSTWISWEIQYINPDYKKDYGRKRFIFTQEGDDIIYTIDSLNLDGDDITSLYYQYKNSKEILIVNPYQFEYGNIGEFLVTSIAIPIINQEGDFCGLVGVDINIERFSLMVDTIKPFGGYAFLLSNDGNIVAHPTRENEGKSFYELNIEEEARINISDKISHGEKLSFLTRITWDGKPRYITFAPIFIEGIDSPWSLGIVVPVPNIMIRANRSFKVSLVIGLIALILMAAIIYILSKTITKPLGKITRVLTKLSHGELSDIEPIRIGSRDEIGQMARELNSLTRNLKKIADFAVAIGEGKRNSVYNPLGENDVLGKALLKMQHDLNDTSIKLERSIEKAVSATNAKSIFLANMSHEIRTPLNGIIGMTDILKEAKLTATQKEYLEIIEVSGNNLLTIINDILDFSKIESGQIELEKIELNLRKELKQIIKILEIKSKRKNLYLNSDIDESLPMFITGDPVRIRQILLNLINNAIKFTEKGGITISIKVVKKSKKSIVLMTRISDTGIGISEAGMKRLFKSFSQTDISITRKYGGTGLGLAISKRLVELMSGKIGVESIEGKGSTFWFECKFKLPDENIQLINTKELDNLQVEARALSILIAEDNIINQKVISLILNKAGHKVEVAENGLIALNRVKETRFDLILMDVQMPVMDGVEATIEIRKMEVLSDRGVRIPIVALTANALSGDRERFIEAGMDAYLSKPFKPDELEQILTDLNIK